MTPLGRGEVLWEPPGDVWRSTAAGRFASLVGHRSYPELHHWSIAETESFWDAVAEFTGIRWRRAPEAVLSGRSMPGARWFPGRSSTTATTPWPERRPTPGSWR